MPSSEESERKVVKTYVPEYQKDNWRAHAEALDMSQSEFVRTMVQAGRREFGLEEPDSTTPDRENTSSPDETPGVGGLEPRILAVLRDGPKTWDQLVDELVGDIEGDLDDTLQSLQSEGRVRYSGRTGGYELVDE